MREYRLVRLFYINQLLEEPKKIREIPHPVSRSCLYSDLFQLQKVGLVRIETGKSERDDYVVSEGPLTLEELKELFPSKDRENWEDLPEPVGYIDTFEGRKL